MSLFSSPSMPDPAPPPPPPPNPPIIASGTVQQSGAAARNAAAAAAGAGAGIKTSPQGDTSGTSTAKKTLLSGEK